jgi:23S rRNA pseudouridine2605 synthase
LIFRVQERIQKILSRAGFGSRRDCEKIISDGRVKVNGSLSELGDKADGSSDEIAVDDVPIKVKPFNLKYIAFNKPVGVLSEIYPSLKSRTVRDFISLPDYLFIVGRLDKNSEGLLLVTNDGELANQLTHPRYEHEKEYLVQVKREPDSKQLGALQNGIVLPDGKRTSPARATSYKNSIPGFWLKIVLHEGHKRQIREMGACIGLPVLRIIRIRIGALCIKDLKPGMWRYLDQSEIMNIKSR